MRKTLAVLVFALSVLVLGAGTGWAQMYAVTGGGGTGPNSVYLMNETTGALTFLAQPDFGGAAAPLNLGMPGLAFAPNGDLFVITGESGTTLPRLARLSATTGNVVENIAEISPNNTWARDIAIDPTSGVIYATNPSGSLYTINGASAAASFVGGTDVYGPLAFGADGTLYMAQMNPEVSSGLYTVSKTSGALTLVGSLNRYYIGLGMGPNGMLYGSDFEGSKQLGSAGGTWGDVYRIDPATGGETFLGSNSGYVIHDIAYIPGEARTGVPTLGLAGMGLLVLLLAAGGLFVLRWRMA